MSRPFVVIAKAISPRSNNLKLVVKNLKVHKVKCEGRAKHSEININWF